MVGNSEIRLRFGETTVYSNFGINNGYYKSNQLTVDALLKAEDLREIEILGYECFEVIFN